MTPSLPPAKAPIVTIAEQSGWRKTGRYDEVIDLCRRFPKRYPGRARCFEFGRTPERRPLLALAVSDDGTLEPSSARRKKRPVVLVQGGIHPGEIEGKDAGFLLLRDLLDGKASPGSLKRVTVVFIPVFNVDGHERFGPNNRPNQRGPEEMGWRVTSQNLNLNRDYTKVESPEMKALLALMNEWDPILYIDLHATDGAKFEHDVSVLVEPRAGGDPGIEALAKKSADALGRRLTQQGHLPLCEFYPYFNKTDDPSSGFNLDPSRPLYSSGYWPLRNRLAALVETHSWKDYANRIRSTYDSTLDLIEQAADDGKAWTSAAKAADEADRQGKEDSIPLVFEPIPEPRMIEFRGYAYTREPSEVSGQLWVRYDESKPEIWKVPFYDKVRPSVVARIPKAGYIVEAGWAAIVAEKLKAHGFAFVTLAKPAKLLVEVFRADEAKFRPRPFEARQLVEFRGVWKRETREISAGSLFVPSAQVGRRLLAHLLEPQGPDSLGAWGFFNAAFEQKEYMEDYVIEEEARKMLQRDPSLKAEFERRLKEDPVFAKDPAARLAFFYRRHPAWDERKDLYPVYRADTSPL